MDGWTDRQADRQTDRHTGKQAGRQAGKQAGRQTDSRGLGLKTGPNNIHLLGRPIIF